jgi:hypothetical protein
VNAIFNSNVTARRAIAAAGLVALCIAPLTSAQDGSTGLWWSEGSGHPLPDTVTYSNQYGELGILNTAGRFETAGHAFFEPIGTNGRACVTCHQPANAMSLSTEMIQQRWHETNGTDPLFAAIDGRNCPHLPAGDREAHSLLLERGLIRVFLPWPPRDAAGHEITPEFEIEVVRDPTGCNTHPFYGLDSDEPMVSVYRRPRMAANLKYVTAADFGVGPFSIKDAAPTSRDPETGRLVNMNMMADAREPTLKTQAVSAALGHLQTEGPPSEGQLAEIIDFETQIYAAQIRHRGAGDLAEPGGPQALGPQALVDGSTGVLGNNTTRYIFPMGDVWQSLPRTGDADQDAEAEFRESVARGHDVFFFRTFWIRDAMHINNIGLGNPIKRTCSTCHGMHMTGMDVANGWMDLGTTNLPWADEVLQDPWSDREPELPLFRLTCSGAHAPHPFLGRTIFTQDPGRALITGKCNDIGAIVMGQFRGIAARAPYFVNGSAKNLRELIDFYDRRFNIRYSDQEKIDLENFLSTL